jgi:hypothetical protein
MTEEGHDLAPMSVVVAPDGTAAVLWRRVVRPTPADFPNPPLIEHASFAKYSATGQPLWQRKLPAQVDGRGLTVDRQGNLIVVTMAKGGDGPDFGAGALVIGSVRGHVSLGGGTLHSAGTAKHDAFVARWAP